MVIHDQGALWPRVRMKPEKFGVHSAMPSAAAYRLCLDAVFIRSRFDVYRVVSAQIGEIFYEYTDLVEPLSLAETFLDVTDNYNGLQIICIQLYRQI